MCYSANKRTFAIYPIAVEYLKNKNLTKSAIVFISKDLQHDHQQIQGFEKRFFEIMRDKLETPPKHWVRFSDGCSAQFKSRFVNADLQNSLELFGLETATFNYYESHERKNISDSIGSMAKASLRRAVLKVDESVSSAQRGATDAQ